jgi:hypothetical protein
MGREARSLAAQIVFLNLFFLIASGQSSDSTVNGSSGPADPPDFAPIAPSSITPVVPPPALKIQWGSLTGQSLGFLAIEEGFRYMREEGARHEHLPFWGGYVKSVTNLHGWADGDPFYVNYVGHPMQGSVSGYIWVQNDSRYRDAEIGKNRHYWKSRLRAAAFSFAYSEISEIGFPLSEASIGATQAYFPQQGFVDHVVTPTIGMVWMIVEDTMDKYVVKEIEKRTVNPYLKLALRGGLNPSRSLANVLAGQLPWHRYTRTGVFEPRGKLIEPERKPLAEGPYAKVAPFEFFASVNSEQSFSAGGPCTGGGAEGAIRTRASLQLVLQVDGCKMSGLQENRSGDSLRFMAGPRWTPLPEGRWSPFVEFLAGGRKLSTEDFYPEKKSALAELYAQQGKELDFPDHALYTSNAEAFGFAVKAGAGVDMKMTNALAFRVASVDYMHSWTGPINGMRFDHGLQVTSGLVLRMGTW